MNQDLISVIVPVYNVEEYLDRCVNSLVRQTYKNLEIILIDDGSTDNSGKKCDEWAQMDNRIKVIHKENGGVSSARNIGLDNATGNYISIVDSDDYLELTTYDDVNNIIDKYDIDIVRFQYRKELNKYKQCSSNSIQGLISYENDKSEILDLFLKKHEFGAVWCSVFKKNIINNIRFLKDLKFGEDYYFYLITILNSNSMYIMSDCYYHYVCNSDSVTQKFDLDKMMISFENHYRVDVLVYEEIVKSRYDTYKKSCLECTYNITVNLLKTLAYNVNYHTYKKFIKDLQEKNFYKKYKDINTFYEKEFENMLNNRRSFYYMKFKVLMFFKMLVKNTMK